MPSGAKKRKAAKKKKEIHSNPSIGGDDSKHHEDKDSDAGEVSSPASQIEIGEESKILVESEKALQIERAFKIEDESDKKDVKFERDETDGGSSRSSSTSSGSSSDDESRGIKSSQDVVDISPVVDPVKIATTDIIEEAGDSVVENIPAVELDKISLSDKAEVDFNAAADDSSAPYIVESVFKDIGEEKQSLVEDKVGTSDGKEGEIVQCVETVTTIADPKESFDREKDSGLTEPLLAPAPHQVQTTSWKSCCGLFEVFAGSGR